MSHEEQVAELTRRCDNLARALREVTESESHSRAVYTAEAALDAHDDAVTDGLDSVLKRLSDPRSISEWVTQIHELSRAKGWYDDAHNIPRDQLVIVKLALIHSEISEVLECVRDGAMGTYRTSEGKPEGFPIELADALIRICDLAGFVGCDLEAAVYTKHAFNKTRPHRHGGKRA